MKGHALFIFTVSLATLGINSIAFAQSQRYPTNAEIQRLIRDFPSVIQSNRVLLPGYPTASETQRLRSFVREWSRVNPTIAPFLGQWQIDEAGLAIYPSNIRGRVCIVALGDMDDVGELGTVVNSQIRTNKNWVIFRQANYLGSVRIVDNKPKIFPLDSPLPLESPTRFLREQTRQEFNAAGCTASLPNRR
ncbi:hypothetical protein [Aerosakkonema funiforme]|uniref:hypothetical protein n=1 Tax=Aerosakkonema funiforme TaxID=1246630 RepID=UPI0035BA4DE5